MTDATDALLAERAKTHGSFKGVSHIAQAIKEQLDGAVVMDCEHREAIDMIASKLARIACGDAHHRDHWDDIAGYARLGAMACKPASATERQATQAGDGWLEWDTAPTDGSRILAWHREFGVVLARYDDATADWWAVGRGGDDDEWFSPYMDSENAADCERWMPLPASPRPPAAPQAVSGGNEAAETQRASTGVSVGAEGHLVLPNVWLFGVEVEGKGPEQAWKNATMAGHTFKTAAEAEKEARDFIEGSGFEAYVFGPIPARKVASK